MQGKGERLCNGCSRWLALADFNWRRKAKGQRDNMCRSCRSDYKRQHYLANRERYIAQAAERKRRMRLERTELLIAYFRSHPCADCGETDFVVLEFDHLADKEFDIGAALSYRNWASILAEMKKCEVVCANCHRRRTASRRGSVRSVMAAALASEDNSE